MIRQVIAKTASAHPKLSIISPSLTTSSTKVGNQGTSTKTPDIAPCTNLYDRAPSGRAGRAVLSSSRNLPRTLLRNEDGSPSIEIGFLEKHPYTSQSFIPMGSKADAAYVVVVADDCADGTPDFGTIQAYVMKGNEGICYAAGVWHAPMAVIHEALDFGIFQYMNGVADEDCEMIDLIQLIEVVI